MQHRFTISYWLKIVLVVWMVFYISYWLNIFVEKWKLLKNKKFFSKTWDSTCSQCNDKGLYRFSFSKESYINKKNLYNPERLQEFTLLVKNRFLIKQYVPNIDVYKSFFVK